VPAAVVAAAAEAAPEQLRVAAAPAAVARVAAFAGHMPSPS
jgi:hypothetical protein